MQARRGGIETDIGGSRSSAAGVEAVRRPTPLDESALRQEPAGNRTCRRSCHRLLYRLLSGRWCNGSGGFNEDQSGAPLPSA